MTVFEMVKYHNQIYPVNIPLCAEECAAHFDITTVSSMLTPSLHTEYSYGKRRFKSDLIQRFPTILEAQKNGVPQLWKSEQWANEFSQFIFALTDDWVPHVIEVHPPFTDYATFDSFLLSYTVFEDAILDRFPKVSILIENRCGSVYKGGRFLISKLSETEQLCNLIVQNGLRLKIAYDVPQIYTAHNVKKTDKYIELLEATTPIREQIGGVHLWGKRRSESGRLVAHCGDLTSYFSGDTELKMQFLQAFKDCFDDGVTRKMVLEVNSGNEDLLSIINDLVNSGITFV
ncbi:MAG: hypothetical protein E7559_00940 [Ruminococcaceae bacterium]|nr:hypothetical protein [Oscillospiraceae bacterium]